jgi:hypothetical protein
MLARQERIEGHPQPMGDFVQERRPVREWTEVALPQDATTDDKYGFAVLRNQILQRIPGRPARVFGVVRSRCIRPVVTIEEPALARMFARLESGQVLQVAVPQS